MVFPPPKTFHTTTIFRNISTLTSFKATVLYHVLVNDIIGISHGKLRKLNKTWTIVLSSVNNMFSPIDSEDSLYHNNPISLLIYPSLIHFYLPMLTSNPRTSLSISAPAPFTIWIQLINALYDSPPIKRSLLRSYSDWFK